MPEGRAQLEIYVDHSVIEIGGNDEWISSRVYPSREDAIELNVRIDGGKGSYELPDEQLRKVMRFQNANIFNRAKRKWGLGIMSPVRGLGMKSPT